MVRVFSHWLPANTVFQILVDLLLLGLALLFSVLWLGHGEWPDSRRWWPYAVFFGLGMLAVNSLYGVYRRDRESSTLRISVGVLLCSLFAVPLAYGMLSPVHQAAAWREQLGPAMLMSLALIAALRGYASRNAVGALRVRRVLVLGTGVDAAAVAESLASSGPYVHVVGFFPAGPDPAIRVAGEQVLAAGGLLAQAVRQHKVNEIIVAVREQRADPLLARELLDCRLSGVRVLDQSSHFERVAGQVRLDSLRHSWLIFGDGFRQGLLRQVAKRLFDVLAATLLLAVFWPLMLLSAVLIVLESGFPVFYGQQRVGQGGRLFEVLKFRSMRRDAEQDGQPRWAASNDMRVTAVGRRLRRLRIDELPQIWNVLRGDMSLCGPRPERPYFVAQLAREIPFYDARHSVKPGVTGWAQVRYRYGESVADAVQKLQYDLYYVKNHTLFLDTLILFKTVGVVLSGAGAR